MKNMSKVKGQKSNVVVALSGGVDSSLAAALLLEQGYNVIGAFMKNWSDTKTVRGECAWKEERRDAQRVAVHLGIPLHTFDFEEVYRNEVVGYLFREYGAGRTPNPDVFCNSEVKFPLFWEEAKKLGADLIATGHHVRKCQASSVKRQASEWKLLAGKDSNKDQSYFLHRLTQDDLSHTLFPIGEYTKEEVRTMARERGIPTADKRSTRGICFVGKVSMPRFLSQAIKPAPGHIQTADGRTVGTHQGIAPYTIGQRHGFGVGGGTPYYVVEKNPVTNTLIVGDENDPRLFRSEIEIADMHWISGDAPAFPFACQARIRYRSELVPCNLSISPSLCLSVNFNKPMRAPASGQFMVFYDHDVCVGGAVMI
ncbi:MAG: tRNA 2-thiouridine(34) synthase MnmA [bacterium]|nr:tRNA 2-thiouridine(34) synthase MnmA [bacterium]